jgi:hypothetical protein
MITNLTVTHKGQTWMITEAEDLGRAMATIVDLAERGGTAADLCERDDPKDGWKTVYAVTRINPDGSRYVGG